MPPLSRHELDSKAHMVMTQPNYVMPPDLSELNVGRILARVEVLRRSAAAASRSTRSSRRSRSHSPSGRRLSRSPSGRRLRGGTHKCHKKHRKHSKH